MIKKQQRQLKELLNSKRPIVRNIPAIMGNGSGVLNVPGRENYVYVLINEKIYEAFSGVVVPDYGKHVWVGVTDNDKAGGRLYQVLSTRVLSGTDPSTQLGYAPAKRYEWLADEGGQDPLNVHLRAFTPLKLGMSATGGMSADLYSGFVFSGSAWLHVARQDVDVTAHIPVAAGKVAMVLITINTSGTVVQTKGSEVNTAALVVADIPQPPSGTAFVCGALRVYTAQTELQEARTNSDFVDLRFPGFEPSSFVDYADILNLPAVFPPDTSYTDLLYPTINIALIPPTINDDSGDGFKIGDLWIDTVAQAFYIAIDVTVGAAVWSSGGGGGGVDGVEVDGALATGVNVPNAIIVTSDTTINAWYIYCKTPGSANTTTVDINLNGTTIFTTQANRPQLAWNDGNGWAVSGTPDFVDFVEGDIITFDIDAIATGAADLVIAPLGAASGGGGGSGTAEVSDLVYMSKTFI